MQIDDIPRNYKPCYCISSSSIFAEKWRLHECNRNLNELQIGIWNKTFYHSFKFEILLFVCAIFVYYLTLKKLLKRIFCKLYTTTNYYRYIKKKYIFPLPLIIYLIIIFYNYNIFPLSKRKKKKNDEIELTCSKFIKPDLTTLVKTTVVLRLSLDSMEAFERKIFPRRPFIFCTTNTRNKVEWRNDALLDCASLYNSACVANQLRYISPFPTLIFFQILNPFCTSDELRRGNWCPCKTFRRLKDRSRFPLSLSLSFSLLE